MWADTLLNAERHHLLRLLVWAGLSILGGTAVFLTLVIRRVRSALLSHFAAQMTAWGVVIVMVAAVGLRRLHLRDVSGAAHLERLLWANIGLDIGYIGIGATLAITSYVIGRKMAGVGAGVGVIIQGLALLLLDLQFAALVSR